MKSKAQVAKNRLVDVLKMADLSLPSDYYSYLKNVGSLEMEWGDSDKGLVTRLNLYGFSYYYDEVEGDLLDNIQSSNLFPSMIEIGRWTLQSKFLNKEFPNSVIGLEQKKFQRFNLALDLKGEKVLGGIFAISRNLSSNFKVEPYLLAPTFLEFLSVLFKYGAGLGYVNEKPKNY